MRYKTRYWNDKGQYSPTSEFGKKTKSSPQGTVDYDLHPLSLALASEATFVARTIDTDVKHMTEVFEAAAHHKGSAFVEILQNCVIFNDNAFAEVSEKESREDSSLKLIEGQPLIFGKHKNKGIRLNGLRPEVVAFDPTEPPRDLLVHQSQLIDPTYAYFLARMDLPEFPVPLGVFRSVHKPTYENLIQEQVTQAIEQQGKGNLEKLLNRGETWVVN